MNAREEIAKAVAVYGDPNSGVLAKAGAEGVIRSHGLDPEAALAEARSAAGSGLDGRLRKDVASAGAVTIAVPGDNGGRVVLEMSRGEASALVCAAFDALGRSPR